LTTSYVIANSPASLFSPATGADFRRNFRPAAVLNWKDTMKNEPQELPEMRRLLSRLPDAPVSSNFTARVMQAVEREETRPAHGWAFAAWNWHALLPRFAVAVAVVLFAGFAVHQYASANRRAGITRSVMLVAKVQQLPSVEALQNFDAIQRMGQPAHADEGLLALAPDLK
jgi:hypothetical protein